MPGPMSKPEVAALGAVFKCIPASRATISVTGTSGTSSLSAYAGRWIFLRALTLDITILRGSQTLTAGQGLVIGTADGHVDWFVDPDDDLTLSHIASGSATLEILY